MDEANKNSKAHAAIEQVQAKGKMNQRGGFQKVGEIEVAANDKENPSHTCRMLSDIAQHPQDNVDRADKERKLEHDVTDKFFGDRVFFIRLVCRFDKLI